MEITENNIVIIGAGSFGTALGNVLASKKSNNIDLLTVEEDVCEQINSQRRNLKYFPNIRLRKRVKATLSPEILRKADIIFIAIPSSVAINYVLEHKKYIPSNALLINTAKGFGENNKIISIALGEALPNPVAALKGPSFAIEVINNMPTAFTFAASDKKYYEQIQQIFKHTNLYLDFTTDIFGTELLSVLKNIYAIIVGVIDAHFGSANVRFMVLTKIFNEMKNMLAQYGGKEKTIFNYCGYGDFGLTALNDLSRNRTMGLLIGKGFINEKVSGGIVLEGKRALNIFYEELRNMNMKHKEFPLLFELYKLLNSEYNQRTFVTQVLKI